MRASEGLRKRFIERLQRGAISTAIEVNDAGLVFGAGTVLARMTRDEGRDPVLDLNADRQRIFALLAVAYGRVASPDVFSHIEGASEQWRRGDKALANIRLAFARLPRLEDRASVTRLFHAEDLLERGVSPRALMLVFGFDSVTADLAKYDPNQPRVPAGSGRNSGQWGDGSGTGSAKPAHTHHPSITITSVPTEGQSQGRQAFVGATAARVGVGSFLAEIAPETLEALATFASRFTLPTAVLGALIIPSFNDGVTAQGTLPDHPDVSYRLDRPEGMLALSAKTGDGSDITIRAQNRNGVYVDIATGTRIGRDLQGDLFLSWDAVQNAIEARKDANPQAAADAQSSHDSNEPQLCPAPVKDIPHGAKDRALDYEDDVHARVNPLAPIPRGFAVMFMSPVTGKPVHFDDCFRYTGDLVDGDMHKGDGVDAKGAGYEPLLLFSEKTRESVMADLIKQAKDQLAVTQALGIGLKWYFAEQGAADYVRMRFAKEGLGEIVIAYMPPRRRK
ncbi:MAG: hypothetical protein ACYC5H_09305 [Methylovirgula sp.]